MANQYQALLEPVRLGPLDVANRIVSTAHGSFLDFYRPGFDPERYVAYQERRARGGVGLTILQPLHVHATSQTVGHHRYDADDLRPKLDLLGRRVHAHGTRVLVQLIHFGAEFRSDANEDLLPLWSFSGTISPSGSEASHEMTTAEVHEVVAGFGRAAALAAASGLDGVELNATHGYLLQQSFTPLTNTRSDEWGEPMRFLVEVMRAVRHELGPDRVLSVRISVDDFLRPEAGGLGPAGLREVAQAIVATGLADMINHSEGARAAHYARSVATYRHPHGEFLPLTAELRRSIDAAVPVVGVGRITTPELATEAVLEGRCDLVAMTRAQIADPDLVTKLRAGGRIRPCVGANQGCVDRMLHGLPITCFHNPEVGQEVRWARVGPTRRRRRLVVVGGGPAGLKAAEVAARRGHEVVLVEAGAEVGGRLRIGAVGDAAELLGSIDWLTAELEDLGVKAQTGCELDERGLADLQPEVVVLATGARPDPDALAAGRSDGSVPVVSLEDAIAADLSRRRVLVIDQRGDAAVARTAERVLASGADVVVATPMASNGAHLGFTHVKDHLEAMWTGGAEMEASTTFAGIADGAVTTRHVHSKRVSSRPFDVVVAGTFGRPDLRLAPAAERLAARVLLAGDVVAPRTALHAFREGALVAAEV